jgi:hypothetical protein
VYAHLVPEFPAFVVLVEAKAFFGAAYLGDPNNAADKRGWSAAQRNWYNKVAAPTHALYYIALWLYPAREKPARVMQQDASLFLIPPPAYMEVENRLNGRRTLALTADLEREHAYKTITADKEFAPYRLEFRGGLFHIPEHHHIYRTLEEGIHARTDQYCVLRAA